MAKLQDARHILASFDLPDKQQNEIAGYTLLALAGVRQTGQWSNAQAIRVSIHDILQFAREEYGRDYAENTRETVRREVIHQLEQARIIDKNPDNPGLPVNSPLTHYALTEEALTAIQAYGTTDFQSQIAQFMDKVRSLRETYEAQRKVHKIPVKLPSGEMVRLSPGEHNNLEKAIVEEFAPTFAPGAELLHLGEAADKHLLLQEERLEELGVNAPHYGKLPDVILYAAAANCLFLIEAVTSHGPVSPKRVEELRELTRDVQATCVLVTAFQSRNNFRKHAADIAWETEVWIAEEPSHMIHFNGDKFLPTGPNPQGL